MRDGQLCVERCDQLLSTYQPCSALLTFPFRTSILHICPTPSCFHSHTVRNLLRSLDSSLPLCFNPSQKSGLHRHTHTHKSVHTDFLDPLSSECARLFNYIHIELHLKNTYSIKHIFTAYLWRLKSLLD